MIAFRIQKVVAKKNKLPMAFLSTLERASVKIKQYFRFARLPFATVNKECALAFIRCCFLAKPVYRRCRGIMSEINL